MQVEDAPDHDETIDWHLEQAHRRRRDLARFRTALPDDCSFHDHHRTVLGRLDGADAYVASVAALQELAPAAVVGQPLHHLGAQPHGTLSIGHGFGTLVDGGPFESAYVRIVFYGPDGMTGSERFELDQRDAALVRLAELGPARTG